MVEMAEWKVSGDCTEACTSPAVCPYYWGSSTPKDLHDGKNQCEGAFTFHIARGENGKVKLDGLNVGICFNSPVGGMTAREPWKSVIYVDSSANPEQSAALEAIFKTCWSTMGQVLKVKKAPISFVKEPVGNAPEPGYKHQITWGNVYGMKAEPLMAANGQPRYISGMMNGKVYVGRSIENKLNEPDLPRGKWDSPGMSNTYYPFTLNPEKLQWMP